MVFSANNSLSNAELFHANAELTSTTLTTLLAGTANRFTYITGMTITATSTSNGSNAVALYDESTLVSTWNFDGNGRGIAICCNFDCPIKADALGNDFKVQAAAAPTGFVANIFITGFKAGN